MAASIDGAAGAKSAHGGRETRAKPLAGVFGGRTARANEMASSDDESESESGSSLTDDEDDVPYPRSGIIELSTSSDEEQSVPAASPAVAGAASAAAAATVGASVTESKEPVQHTQVDEDGTSHAPQVAKDAATAANQPPSLAGDTLTPEAIPELEDASSVPGRSLSDVDHTGRQIVDNAADIWAEFPPRADGSSCESDLEALAEALNEGIGPREEGERQGPEASFEYGSGDIISPTIPSPRDLSEEREREKRAEHYRKKEKKYLHEMRRMGRRPSPRAMMMMREREMMHMDDMEAMYADGLDLEGLDAYELRAAMAAEREDGSSDEGSSDSYYDAEEEYGEAYDGDDEEVAELVTEKLSSHVSREVNSLRSADEERKRFEKRQRDVGEDGECANLNSLQRK